jgi:Tol biopolymer transport system component
LDRPGEASRVEIEDAEHPVASSDGKWLAYLRSIKGKSRLWLRSLQVEDHADTPITPPELDVREMSFFPDGSLVFAAAAEGRGPQIFTVDRGGNILELEGGETRFPAASPDGGWLAYSRENHGVWNLWLRNMHSGETRRLSNGDCNDMSPAWEADSRTLVYASDCGRALWFTALYRRRAVP